jgi:5'(3')-deoxyribonucleotidase
VIIGLDVDETVSDLHTPWLEYGNGKFGTNFTAFTSWDCIEEWWGKAAFDFIHPCIYENDEVMPIRAAREAVDLLRALGHQIRFVTSCVNDTEEAKCAWLQRHGFTRQPSVEFLPGRDKSRAPVDVLVDDGFHNVSAFHGKAVLVTAPHNAHDAWQGVRIKHVAELPRVLSYL